MKKLFIAAAFIIFGTVGLMAQGTLQFGQAMIITPSSGVQTVPAGKVWKVMSVFGKATLINTCYALEPYCVNSSWPSSSTNSIEGKGYKVNGNVVWQEARIASGGVIYYQNANCSGATTQFSSYPTCVNFVNTTLSQGFDELSATLPFWLPAGATLETLGAQTFISVVEFNIIP